MKKLIFILALISSLFANSITISSLKNTNKALFSISVDDDAKIIYFTGIYKINANNININNLENVKKYLTNVFCNNIKLRNAIENGYLGIIEYIYMNGVVVRVVVNSCPI